MPCTSIHQVLATGRPSEMAGRGNRRFQPDNRRPRAPMVKQPPMPVHDGTSCGIQIAEYQQKISLYQEWDKYLNGWTYQVGPPNLPDYPGWELFRAGELNNALVDAKNIIAEAIRQDLTSKIESAQQSIATVRRMKAYEEKKRLKKARPSSPDDKLRLRQEAKRLALSMVATPAPQPQPQEDPMSTFTKTLGQLTASQFKQVVESFRDVAVPQVPAAAAPAALGAAPLEQPPEQPILPLQPVFSDDEEGGDTTPDLANSDPEPELDESKD